MWILMPVLAMSLAAKTPPELHIAGEWQVQVSPGTVVMGRKEVTLSGATTLTVSPPPLIQVRDELYERLPLFNPNTAPWVKGERLRGLITQETSAPGLLKPDSLVLKNGKGNAPPYKQGEDYDFDPLWATFGRLNGKIQAEPPVWVDYDYGSSRLDAVVVNAKGEVSLRQGEPHIATPLPPSPRRNETILAHIWVPGRLTRLTEDNLYPIVEPHYIPPVREGQPPAATLLPKTWAKLHNGEKLQLLAWGDSVTESLGVSDKKYAYQYRFVALLKQRFPKADIQLTTVAWAGRNTESFLKEPPGSPYNFAEAVLGRRPDLILTEFINDSGLTPEKVEERYSSLLERFREIGAEWLLLTPHYARPDFMGQQTERITEDPRAYVSGLRQFAAKHQVALADASLRWGHLLKEGIPYMTLLANCINHPNDRGHALFTASLMELF